MKSVYFTNADIRRVREYQEGMARWWKKVSINELPLATKEFQNVLEKITGYYPYLKKDND